MKKTLCVLSAMALLLTGCSSIKLDNTEEKPKSTEYVDLRLGKDYTDLKTSITVLTHRTDIIQDTEADNELPDYAKKFNKLYPNITVVYEGVTDYDFDVKNRLSSGKYGDVLYIPAELQNSELSQYFVSLGTTSSFYNRYNFIESKAYEDNVYGIPSGINAQGIVYNKKVFEEAGIKELPKTPDEFIADLKLIKDNTDAIPLYTNYAAEWPLVTWDFNAFANTTNVNYKNEYAVNATDLFSKHADGTGPYDVYNILYTAANEGLIEEDPTKTSWEMSKAYMNSGDIGTMVLGSWAVSQIQGAGDFADDINYMPFPISIDGKQYALAGSDYCYAINNNIDEDKQIAAKLYIKFMIEQSRYDYNNSSIPVVKENEYPMAFANFVGVELLPDIITSKEFDDKNTKSGLNINSDAGHIVELIDRAIKGDKFDDIMNNWNDKWNS